MTSKTGAKEALFTPKEDEVFDVKATGALKALHAHADSLANAKPREAVAQIMEGLDAKEREALLSALLWQDVRRRRREDDSKKLPDFGHGESGSTYPYKRRYPKKRYESELVDLQVELLKLQEWVKAKGARVVVIFEGRDTAGKGGTILRFVENINPRGSRVVALNKPTPEEAKQWYFQRYAAHLPNPGEICFFDRSWYNRAVVEPVMGFCTPEQSATFLSEVAYFERSLVNSGIILVKFWLSISQKEQLRRFRERRNNPLKRWKLSPVDLASVEKWDDYTRAMHAMFEASDTVDAPWTVIRNEDKRRGRLNAIRCLLSRIDYDGKSKERLGEVDPSIVLSVSRFLKGE